MPLLPLLPGELAVLSALPPSFTASTKGHFLASCVRPRNAFGRQHRRRNGAQSVTETVRFLSPRTFASDLFACVHCRRNEVPIVCRKLVVPEHQQQTNVLWHGLECIAKRLSICNVPARRQQAAMPRVRQPINSPISRCLRPHIRTCLGRRPIGESDVITSQSAISR